MNKKNITINTDFFEDGTEAKLIEYSEGQTDIIEGKEVSSRVDQYQTDSIESSISNYRYQFAPDNEYSHSQTHADSSEQFLARKLHSANEIENILSRAQARLFIGWWEELIAKLHELRYSGQGYKSIQQAQKQEILQDYNNVFNNDDQQNYENLTGEELKQNVFANRQIEHQSIEQRKRELVERQKQGITLDSFEKLKTIRSNSGAQLHSQKEQGVSLKPNQQSKQTFVNEQNEGKSVSGVSRKSYRDKFLDYKHRSRSKEAYMPQGQTYSKFVSYRPQQTSFEQAQFLNRAYTGDRMRNVQSATNIQESKNDILRNINHLLMDREDIYQGQDCRYYINHRDSSKNIYALETHSHQNYPGSSYQRPVKMAYKQQGLTDMQSTQLQEDEMVRARLIEEIVQKLKYSKIRLEEVHKKQPKQDELEMMRKLSRLEKVIMELKTETQSKSHVREPEVKTYHKSAEQQLYKKFIEEMASIKAQINLIKTLRQSNQAPAQQPQKIVVDNSSNHIISEQQKMLLNYQRQYERLINEKQKVVVGASQPQKPTVVQADPNGQQSLIGQMIQNAKSQTKKVGWDDGWQVKEQMKESHSTTNFNQISNQTKLSQSVYRNQHLNKSGYENYRYTRKQVLQDIGMRNQVQAQERVWRQAQARQQLDRQRREIEVREMTQKVKLSKKSQSNNEEMDDGKSMRQRHEENWEKYQKKRIDVDEDMNKNFFCQLFPCK